MLQHSRTRQCHVQCHVMLVGCRPMDNIKQCHMKRWVTATYRCCLHETGAAECALLMLLLLLVWLTTCPPRAPRL